MASKGAMNNWKRIASFGYGQILAKGNKRRLVYKSKVMLEYEVK